MESGVADQPDFLLVSMVVPRTCIMCTVVGEQVEAELPLAVSGNANKLH